MKLEWRNPKDEQPGIYLATLDQAGFSNERWVAVELTREGRWIGAFTKDPQGTPIAILGPIPGGRRGPTYLISPAAKEPLGQEASGDDDDLTGDEVKVFDRACDLAHKEIRRLIVKYRPAPEHEGPDEEIRRREAGYRETSSPGWPQQPSKVGPGPERPWMRALRLARERLDRATTKCSFPAQFSPPKWATAFEDGSDPVKTAIFDDPVTEPANRITAAQARGMAPLEMAYDMIDVAVIGGGRRVNLAHLESVAGLFDQLKADGYEVDEISGWVSW